MVEGGQRIISSFLSHLDSETQHVVDILIVTIAPTFVGAAGVGAFSQGFSSVRECHRSVDNRLVEIQIIGAEAEARRVNASWPGCYHSMPYP
jgi:riboflavin biosynthesis pyrimidine reductase